MRTGIYDFFMKFPFNGFVILPVLLAGLSCKPPAQPAGSKGQTPGDAPANGLVSNDPNQQQLDWNRKTTVGAYDKCGHKNPKWDESAHQALEAFAYNRSLPLYPSFQTIFNNKDAIVRQSCMRAVDAGCDDPLIEYLHARYLDTAADQTKAMVKAAQDMETSQYPEIRKCYACLRAALMLEDQLPAIVIGPGHTRKTMTPEIREFQKQYVGHLVNALSAKDMPQREMEDICKEAMLPVSNNKENTEWFWSRIEESLLNNHTNDAAAWLIKGKMFIDLAWIYRGGGYANTVKDEQWKAFAEKLAVAEQALNHAWELDPKNPQIAIQMMRVELGQAKGQSRLDQWFERAMELDTNNFDACEAKYYYLSPQWHGTKADLMAFGRECVDSTRWGGRVPLIMASIHQFIARLLTKEQQAAYWKQPAVWRDLDASYQKFFQINPKANDYLPEYMLAAYRCEQWGKLIELNSKLTTVDYDAFGGKEAYDRMVKLAQQHTPTRHP